MRYTQVYLHNDFYTEYIVVKNELYKVIVSYHLAI